MPDTERMIELAEQVMQLSRNAIVMNLRFMDMAVFRLRPEPSDATLATDGRYLFYGPEHVLRRYMRNEALPARDYLHVLMHCVFRHPYIDTLVDRRLWDLAADIAVESVIASLELPRFEAGRELDQKPVIDALTERLGLLTAEKLYHFFQDNPPPEAWAALFYADDHGLWHRPRARRGDADGQPGGEEADAEGENAGGSRAEATGEEDGERQPAPPGHDSEPKEPEALRETSRRMSGDSAEPRDSEHRSLTDPSDGEGEGEQRPSRQVQSESGSESGDTLYRKDEADVPREQNVGRGMDTEGGEDSRPMGSQTRNERTRNGVESPSASGVSGDSGDAAVQGDASPSGGSGSGQDDAQVLDTGEGDGSESRPDLFEEREAESREQLKREWQDVSERIQLELESQSHQRGTQAGGLQRQLALQNREKYDYAAFLRKFAVLGEHMQLNDDEFDQIFYTYGLKLYGNLPLIEPLETKEVKRVREFVIAIDTSASTSGALVEQFLRRTWEVLSSEESFFRKIHLRIVQCDAEVQESVTLTCLEEFERYMRTFTVKGLGGTDFRPVFRHVDELLRQGEFTQLKGLIYFTDGAGIYPLRKPDYETAFVFVQSPDGADREVPPWAIKLILDEGDIK